MPSPATVGHAWPADPHRRSLAERSPRKAAGRGLPGTCCEKLPIGIATRWPYSERGSCKCGCQGRRRGPAGARSGGR
ncbi:hypothetical protein GEV43_04015 [Actinomadura sp. J1-007]|nr:hypothetical protein [Actinomadura sp. J1-007]